MWKECFSRRENPEFFASSIFEWKTLRTPANRGERIKSDHSRASVSIYQGFPTLMLVIFLHQVIRKSSAFLPHGQDWVPPHVSYHPTSLSGSVFKGLQYCQLLSPGARLHPQIGPSNNAGWRRQSPGSTPKQYNLAGFKQVSTVLTWISSDICCVFNAPSHQTSKP